MVVYFDILKFSQLLLWSQKQIFPFGFVLKIERRDKLCLENFGNPRMDIINIATKLIN